MPKRHETRRDETRNGYYYYHQQQQSPRTYIVICVLFVYSISLSLSDFWVRWMQHSNSNSTTFVGQFDGFGTYISTSSFSPPLLLDLMLREEEEEETVK